MNRKQLVQKIEKLIENGYVETHVGYHAEYRMYGDWQRGCFAQVAKPYDGTYRIYANSYTELLDEIEQRVKANEL